nr:hypothetical protein [Tanacetum cinerariifolium]
MASSTAQSMEATASNEIIELDENDSFKKVMEVVSEFGGAALAPTRYEMEDTFLREEVERTKMLLKEYEDEWKLNGCSIIIDEWSDGKRSILNMCVNSKLVVTANASNNMGVAKLLNEKRPTIIWTSCASHAINLMLEGIGGLPRFKKTLDQAKELTVCIYAHHETLALMRHFTKKRDIVRPRVTKFASAFLTLQSLAEKKFQLRHMFSSEEWEKCKFSNTVKGRSAYAIVVSPSFWTGVKLCLNVFAPLVKVLRMVDAGCKPYMGFISGELKKARQEIIDALNDNKKVYKPIMDIVSERSSGWLDTSLHMAAYILNPYYLYNNLDVQNDNDAIDAVVDVVGKLFPEDYDTRNRILMVEFPMYKGKQGTFDQVVAIKECEVNDDIFDPANWWSIYGGSTPHLRKIAMRILSLTTGSSECERNCSMSEWVHTKKRNRL